MKLNNFFEKINYDRLTGLYNRDYIISNVTQQLKQYPNNVHALLILDLDGFKQINDSYGHNVGDEVLIKVGNCINYTIKKNDFAGRMGGDEYVVFLPNIKSGNKAYELANEIYSNICSLSVSDNIHQNLAVSIGISLNNNCLNTFDKLYKHADIALQNAKKSELSVIINCSDSTHNCLDKSEINESNAKLNLFLQDVALKVNRNPEFVKQYLLDALNNNEFEIVLQPKFSTKINGVDSAEILARWKSPKYGTVMPMNFIKLFEKVNLINEFDTYILNKSLNLLNNWKKKGINLFKLSINQSSILLSTLGYVENLKYLIEKYELNPNLITIEITERSQLTSYRTISVVTDKIIKMGINISIDDFGSGFTSLNMLKQINATEIKLDKLFLHFSDENKQKSLIIIKNLFNLAKELNITTVSEGVETIEQAKFLTNFGCDYLQGFIFSKPISIKTFENKYIKKHKLLCFF